MYYTHYGFFYDEDQANLVESIYGADCSEICNPKFHSYSIDDFDRDDYDYDSDDEYEEYENSEDSEDSE